MNTEFKQAFAQAREIAVAAPHETVKLAEHEQAAFAAIAEELDMMPESLKTDIERTPSWKASGNSDNGNMEPF